MNRKRRREWACALAVCLAMAAVMLLFASQSSPLYPINEWADANRLAGAGHAGGVVYPGYLRAEGSDAPICFTRWRHAFQIPAFWAPI